MRKITISEWEENGTLISSCDLFVENRYGTLGNLRTEKSYLNQGYATSVLNDVERIAEGLGLITISLRVLKGSFMAEWYRRLGFVFFSGDEDEKYEWLYKQIKKKDNETATE